MKEQKKIDPWTLSLEELKGKIDKCDEMLLKKLFPEVRQLTEDGKKELETVYRLRLAGATQPVPNEEVFDQTRLKGSAAVMEKEQTQKETNGFVGELAYVYEKDGEFCARVNFGSNLDDMPESLILRRITSKLIDIVGSKAFKVGNTTAILTSPGFTTLCEYVQALRFIKLHKCKVFYLNFTELEIKDVYKINPPSTQKKKFLTVAILRCVTKVSTEAMEKDLERFRAEFLRKA